MDTMNGRLPGVYELNTLVHYDKTNTATWLGTHGFTNVQANYYWSSTTLASSTGTALVNSVFNGDVYLHSKSHLFYVWPVRGGQR
jgi:hypothetical protein